MKFNIFTNALCIFFILVTVLANEEIEEYNPPPQYRSIKGFHSDEIIEPTINLHRIKNDKMFYNMQDENGEDDVEEDENGIVNNEEEISSQDFIGVGSNFESMAALVPAKRKLLRQIGVPMKRIIGYVPLHSPNGEALVFPAGGIRVVSPEKSVNLNAIELPRANRIGGSMYKNVMRRNHYNGWRYNYPMFYTMEPYWGNRRVLSSTKSKGRKRIGNKKRHFKSKNQFH